MLRSMLLTKLVVPTLGDDLHSVILSYKPIESMYADMNVTELLNALFS
jgi:hypothetical protein